MMYRARLARLERLIGKGTMNCPRCRLNERHALIDPGKPAPTPSPPSLEVYAECEMCGGKQILDLSGCAEGERELTRLVFTSTMETFYTDRRAWIASQWFRERDAALKARKKQRREHERRGQPQHKARAERRPDRKDGPGEKLYDRLQSEWLDFQKRRHLRLQAEHGAPPFPELAAHLGAITHTDHEHLYKGKPFAWRVSSLGMFNLEQEEAAWLRCAEAERIVLGEALASTLEKAADSGRRALEIIDEARRKHEEHEEDERRRREEDERRHREYLESIRAASAPATPPENTPHLGAHNDDPPWPPGRAAQAPPRGRVGSNGPLRR